MRHLAYASFVGITTYVALIVFLPTSKRDDSETWRFIRLIALTFSAAFVFALAIKFVYSGFEASLDEILEGLFAGRLAAYSYAGTVALMVLILTSMRERKLRKRGPQ